MDSRVEKFPQLFFELKLFLKSFWDLRFRHFPPIFFREGRPKPRLFPAAQRELPAHCLIRSVSQNRAQLSMLAFSAINCQPKPTQSSLMVQQPPFQQAMFWYLT